MSASYSVYSLCFEDGTEYVGITRQPLARRLYQHMQFGSHHRKVLRRIYSGRRFAVKVREENLTYEEARELEDWYILSAPRSLNGFQVFARYRHIGIDPLPDCSLRTFYVSNFLRSLHHVEGTHRWLKKFADVDSYRSHHNARQLEVASC